MIPPLQLEIERIAGRIRARRRAGQSAIFWTGAALTGLLVAGLRGIGIPSWGPALAVSALVLAGWLILRSRRPPQNLREAARTIEAAHPELRTALLAAIDQAPENGRLTYLQTRVIDLALASARNGAWDDVAPIRDIRWRRGLSRLGAGVTLVALLAALSLDVADRVTAHRTAAMLEVQPGNAKIERGSPVTFTARFSRDLPATATLQITDATGARRELPLTRTLEDPVFTAALPAVADDLRYHVDFGAGRSEEFTLEVFDPPRVEQVDATLKFPAYTGQPDAKLENPRTVAAIEQTDLALAVRTNVPMRTVELWNKDGATIPLTQDAKDPTRYEVEMNLVKSGDFQVALIDEAGRSNPAAETLQIKVHPNLPPVVKVKMPSPRERAGALQEVSFEARVEDDFGLSAAGLTVQVGTGKPLEVAAPALKNGTRSTVLDQLVKLEDLHAQTNDLIIWNAWGEDIGPDGKPRRTKGDVHLVPVRAFDEVSRQNEGPQGSPGQNGSPAQQLIRLETQILAGTWNVQRDTAHGQPPAADVETLHGAQASALEIAREIEGKISRPELRQELKIAQSEMEKSLASLEAGQRDNLPPAIAAQQAALTHLYRLLSSERLIQQAANSQSPGDEDSVPPQEEIDLENMQPRYQSETAAQDEASKQANEARETVNRLKDLAQRQRDLNEELNRLMNAQRLAKTEAGKAEIARQLRRLRDQQRDLEADLDRTRQRMAESNATQPENTDPRQIDRAAEAAERSRQKMDANKLGEALAEGARAQKDLERAEEDYRKATAGQLTEQLRELRERTREVAENQEKLGKELARIETPLGRRTLRPDPDSFEARAQKQAEDFARLMDSITNTARGAEETEPLVARRLDEAARASEPRGISDALDKMLADASINDRDAALTAQKSAEEGMQALRRRVDAATAKVLGSPDESLQYAQAEIDRLRRELGQASQNSPAAKSPLTDKPATKSPETPGQQPSQQSGQQPGQQPGRKSGEGNSPESAQAGGTGHGAQPGNPPSSDSPDSPARQASGSGLGDGNSATGSQARSAGGSWTVFDDATNFRDWTDRLQDLEAVVELPEARAALARARGAARELRRQTKESNTQPPQRLVEQQVLQPLLEAEARIRQALATTDRRNPLAPVERDPVPEKYSDVVRSYYEALGQ